MNGLSVYSTIAQEYYAHILCIYASKHKLDAVWAHALFRVKYRLSGNGNNKDYLNYHKIFVSQTCLKKSRYPLFNNHTPYWDMLTISVFTAPLN